MDSFKEGVKDIKNKVTNSNSLNKIITKKNQLLEWVEIHPWKTLVVIYFLFVIVKISIYLSVSSSPTWSPDSFVYTRMSRSFFNGDGFQMFGVPTHKYPPLYPILISPSFIFNDMVAVFNMIRIINALTSSLVIFPAYILSNEIINVKKSIFITIIVSMLAANFSYGFFALPENLILPLFLASVFFFYKSIYEKGAKFKFLTGFFVGLCFLTKFTSIVFFPAMLFIFVFADFFKIYNSNSPTLIWIATGAKKWFITSAISVLTILPWFIRNGSIFGFTPIGILGYNVEVNRLTIGAIDTISSSSASSGGAIEFFSGMSIQFLVHNGFLILSVGIMFFILGAMLFYKSFKEKKYNLFTFGLTIFVLAEFLVLLTSWHNIAGMCSEWRLLGRYSTPTIALLIIFGYISLVKLKVSRQVVYGLIISFIPLTFLIPSKEHVYDIFYIEVLKYPEKYLTLLPEIKNFFLTYGELVVMISFSVMILVFIYIIVFKKKCKKYLLILTIILILSTSVLTVTRATVKQDLLTKEGINTIGPWLNRETSGDTEIVLFDNNMKKVLISYIGLWINSPIITGNVDTNITGEIKIDYIISSQKLDFEVVNQGEYLLPPGTVLSENAESKIEVYVYCVNNAK